MSPTYAGLQNFPCPVCGQFGLHVCNQQPLFGKPLRFPHKCPVCNGTTFVAKMFSTTNGMACAVDDEGNVKTEPCQACEKGIVWG